MTDVNTNTATPNDLNFQLKFFKRFNALTQAVTTLALSILVGFVIVSITHFIFHESLTVIILCSSTGALLTGAITLLFLKIYNKVQLEKYLRMIPSDNSGLSLNPQMESIDLLHDYPGDLSKERPPITYNLSNKLLSIQFSDPSFRIGIHQNPILNSRAQVIVNPVKPTFEIAKGIGQLCSIFGGILYNEAYIALKNHYNGKFESGYAAMISCGDLHDKYTTEKIIVVSEPQNKDAPEKESQLYSCFYNSLLLAHQAGKTSIAFPAISAETFTLSKNKLANIALVAIYQFTKQYPKSTLKSISIWMMDTPDWRNPLSTFHDVLDRLVTAPSPKGEGF